MAEKLKSTLDKIHWSLVVKSLVFGLAWLYLPFWFFILLSLVFYLFPLFQPFKTGLPFVIILVFAGYLEPNLTSALFLSIIFSLILGIKDLILINRVAAYEIVVFLVGFLLFLNFFSRFPSFGFPGVLGWSIFMMVLFFFLQLGFVRFMAEESSITFETRRRIIFVGIVSLVLWQFSWVLLFLPFTYFFQAALLFVAAAITLELLASYIKQELDRRKILASFSIFFVFIVILMALTEWGL